MNTFKVYTEIEKASGLFGFLKRSAQRQLIGEITFYPDKITIAGTNILISAIEKISIPHFSDYIGRTEGDKTSEGNANRIEIKYADGKTAIYYFMLERRYQLRDVVEELIAYYKAGKFDFDNLTMILGLENYNAIQNFKNTLSIKSY